MVDRIERGWRVLATALCFAVFGLGGLLVRLVVFPVLSLVPWSPDTHRRVCRDVIHYILRSFLWLMCALGVIQYSVRNGERLRRDGLLIVANHPSLIDIVFLMALTRGADCVVKAGLAHNPFTRATVAATGWIRNDAGGAALVEDCIASLRAGSNLIIFPEGTRTQPGEAPLLQRGAANVAVRGGFDLTPVVIRCEPPTLTKGEKWYRVPARRPRYEIDVHPDLSVAPWMPVDTEAVQAVRRLTRSLSEFFTREIRREGA